MWVKVVSTLKKPLFINTLPTPTMMMSEQYPKILTYNNGLQMALNQCFWNLIRITQNKTFCLCG